MWAQGVSALPDPGRGRTPGAVPRAMRDVAATAWRTVARPREVGAEREARARRVLG